MLTRKRKVFMSMYVVTGKQLLSTTLAIALFLAVCVWFGGTLVAYFDLPEVMVNGEGKCVKVVNYKNGDGYTCQDKDVVLRKYRQIHVQ
jgi:hypothetical protein